ncbi:hypothetical protein O3G_MSEX002600 [Manduca sexta]|uniref:BRCT domain-containing protein n=2 Tax=Manduca sexta TaxID=7130 RepID=A0A922CE68_MANSE|nr:hypothetical protein O3G_MSEX002600 [Manduca sexta]
MSEDIKVTFIIPNDCESENECSEDMQLAFVTCEQHKGSGLHAKWVKESQWKKFEGLSKRDVFVLSEFEGELFQRLRATKCLLVGPRCLSCCLTEGMPIPSGPEPVYTVAMRGLVVTASGLTKDKKEIIKIKVHWMGGTYNTVLTDETTHLISDTVLSVKYVRSVEIGIPVMSETWVDAVWEAALRLNVSGASSDFNNYRLPPFANLEVTTSGIPKRDKQMIMKLVNQHGGKFSGAFQSETTDVVVLTKEGVGSEKYKAALEYGKVCVLPSWVKDSAEKGVALPVAKYKIVGASTSSPLAEHRLPDMSLNFSRITNLRPPSNFVDETRSADVSTASGKIKLSQESRKANDTSIDKELQIELDSFDMNDIKKAGPIFDGFCIWLVNLSGRAREVCAAAVSRCGGYLIHTTPSTPVKCARKQPAEASPMSKKNLQLLRREPLDLPPPTVEVEPEDELVNHYLSQAAVENVPLDREKTPERVAPNSTTNEHPDITEDGEDPTEEIEQIFRGIKFVVQGLDEEAIIEIGAEVSAAGGALCGAGAAGAAGGASHALVPLDFDPEELLTAGAEPVTVFWVKDCLSQQELVPIQYYHRPVRLASWSAAPLQGVVASLSTYSGIERAFLDELAKLLGATTQLRFCRRNTANALASTHLICPTPVGDKYTGALKWGLPAVKASWLMACAKEGKRVSERGHLVGDTKAPPSPAKLPEEAKAEGNPIVQPNKSVDKENAMLPPQGSALPRRGSVPSADNTPKNTPKAKLGNDGTDEMSPASRYIAMARQGLLGGDSQETPSRLHEVRDDDKIDSAAVRTPPLEDALSTPNLQLLSPTTRRRLQALRRGDLPSDPIRTPRDPFDKNLPTPDSAFGAALRPGSGRLSPDARKRLWRVVNELPSKQEQTPTNVNTPLSEIRNRFLAQFNGDAPSTPSDHHLAPRKLHLLDQEDTPPAKMAKISQDQCAGGALNSSLAEDKCPAPAAGSPAVPPSLDAQLQRLNAVLAGRLSSQKPRRSTRDSVSLAPPPAPESEPGPESQPNTVGWDDTSPARPLQPPQSQIKKFMLSSNVDNREEIIEMIQYLGGEVCEGTELDPEMTHLLCAAPGRSEKMLGSIAAGRWVLHPAYVARSRQANKFLAEEEYEWGNPLATCLPAVSGAERVLAAAAHRWRCRRAAGVGGGGGPFTGVVALLHVPPPRRRLLARLVAAGDGLAPDDEPPYNNERITVCFADVKRYPISARDAQWLKSRRIPVCAPVLLSSYLTDDPPPKPEEHCLPEFKLS